MLILVPDPRRRAQWARRTLRLLWLLFVILGALLGVVVLIHSISGGVLFMSYGSAGWGLGYWLLGCLLGPLTYVLFGMLPAACCEVALAVLDLRDGQAGGGPAAS